MTRAVSPFAVAFTLLALTAESAAAQIADPAEDTVTVSAGEGSDNQGRIAVNIAAGTRNQQIGSAVVAIGDLPIAIHDVLQQNDAVDPNDRRTQILVGPGAFSNNSGMASINIAAGIQNQSANLATLTVGNSGVVSDQMLAQTSAPLQPVQSLAQGTESPDDTISINETAFGGNSGLVQVNLVGGERNSSANTFALNVSAGGEP
jgi:hypothetical protein